MPGEAELQEKIREQSRIFFTRKNAYNHRLTQRGEAATKNSKFSLINPIR